MSRRQTESGQIEYTGRALQQDAHDAMRGDIVRGLIELITNADDAYKDEDGKIRIEVEHRRGPWKVIVRDRACGLTKQEMKDKICKLAGRTSGFERGEAVRGQLGRGVKDLVAFGPVTFEAIKNDRYVRMLLEPSGSYEFQDDTVATAAHRKEMGVARGSGMVVTVVASDRIRCPQQSRLADQLANHFQLRGIMADSRREIQLVNGNTSEMKVVRYNPPSLGVAFEGEVTIPGYPGATAAITIFKNAERYDDPASDPCRPAGLLIKGNRAIYENTLFGLENRPQAGWFSGHVECKYIDTLARDYDDRVSTGRALDEGNPFPIVTRRRDGLQQTHPFYRALAKAAEEPLSRLVSAEEKKAREGGARESANLRRSLDVLGRDLARIMNEDLREIDEELEGGDAPGAVPAVRIIPEQVVLYVGEDKTISIQVRADLGVNAATASPDPEGVIELLDGGAIALEAHPRRRDLLIGRIRVKPLLEGKETLLTVTAGDHSNYALVEVRPERVEEDVEIQPPEGFCFERDSYRVAQGKQRTLRLLAPTEDVAREGKNVHVRSSDRGVVVLDGGTIEMRFDDKVEYFVAEVKIDARKLGAKAELVAEVGSLRSTATVVVARDDEGPRLKIQVEDREAGARRAQVDRAQDTIVVAIMGRHPAVRRYFGPGPDFSFQDLSASRAIIAEIVAGEATRMVMEKKYPTGTELDAAALYADHAKYLAKYLTRCHRELVGEASLRQSADAT